MEHRRSERTKVALPVLVKVNGGGLVPATIRNFSAGGMFLQARRYLPVNAHVIVNIVRRGRSRRNRHQLPVVVVRQESEGMGVCMSDGGAVALDPLTAH